MEAKQIIKISVVIPFYEKGEEFKKTWKALKPQLLKGDEVIVVDDWSFTYWFCEYPINVVKPNKLNQHIYRLNTLRNLGIINAGNDAVLILDPDCIPNPDLLENARELFAPEIMYGGQIDWEGKDGLICPDRRLKRTWPYGWQIWGGLMFFSKSRTERFGWFNEEFNGNWGAEEHDLPNRCHFDGMTLQYEPRLKAIHQYHAPSKFKTNKGFMQNNSLAWKRFREYAKNKELIYKKGVK